jgi:NitT/TauT family transport system permease protein
MRRATWYRLLVVAAAIAVLEVLCLVGVIDKITMQAPHLIVRDLYRMLVSGRMNGAIVKTLSNTLLALGLSLAVGIVFGALLHRHRALRDTLDPLFATTMPCRSLRSTILSGGVRIGRRTANPDRIHARRGRSDREHTQRPGPRADRLMKTARILRMSPVDTAMRMTLPAAAPYILTGIKLAVAYAFIGVIGSEFIMSRGGIGYEISFAYTNFDNATMYPLIVLILLASIVINAGLSRWEERLLARRGLR